MDKVIGHSFFSEFDINLFTSGKHFRLYEKFGSHITEVDGIAGTYFAVWAPSAKSVSVIGDFNFWTDEHQLKVRWDSSGIWEGFIPHVGKGTIYKYQIHSSTNGMVTEKADPYARRCEHPPKTASIVWDNNYAWKDKEWMANRKDRNALNAPYSVYEVHLGSWMRKPEEGNRYLSYTELAEELVAYVKKMNFTHVEFMPVMEYPYDPSWGYQITGYFAPSSRFGYPEEFKFLVDAFHKNNIGVILDWVPSHFPEDAHGLGCFDGSSLYEHPDRKKGFHPDWKSLIFNYERNEIRSFLISNAIFWLDHFHVDGLRVDAVASMLFLDYSREEGEWEPNSHGGRENLDAISFLKELNEEVYASFPDVQTIAEESTSFPMVSKPTFIGGLGFGMKWMMGWMNDTLAYFARETAHRKYHQNDLTFSMTYAFTENFMLPLSHDEVVHGKASLINKMPGDEWQQFANLRMLYSYMFTHPGGNLLFMGAEFGQREEWNFDSSLDWHVTQYPLHFGMQELIKDLNIVYRSYPAMYQKQFDADGFEWISYDDSENAVISYIRKGISKEEIVIVVCNLTPVPRDYYRIGIPLPGKLKVVLNSDHKKYGGSSYCDKNEVSIDPEQWHSKPYSAALVLPPLASMIYKII